MDPMNGYVTNGDSSYVCMTCGRVYKTKPGIHNHVKYDCDKDPQFRCPVCPHTTKRKGSLKKHLENVHKIIGVESFPHLPASSLPSENSTRKPEETASPETSPKQSSEA